MSEEISLKDLMPNEFYINEEGKMCSELSLEQLNLISDVLINLQQENQQLKDNWNELKKWLLCMAEVSHLDIMCLNAVLNKMKEILDKVKE